MMQETYRPAEIQRTPIEQIALVPNLPIIYGPQDIEKYLGYVSGVSIQGISVGKEIMAGINDIIGGRIKRYEERYKVAEDQAIFEMLQEAYNLGANAVVNFDVKTDVGVDRTANVRASGVAVRLKNKTV